jgi:hypothetical protein
MDLPTFREHLDRYGADLERWPEDQRGAARQLAGSVEASRLVDQARALDAMLLAMEAKDPPPGLAGRILASLPQDRLSGLLDWLAAAFWRPALAATASLALGFLIGVLAPAQLSDQQLADELSLMTFSDPLQELIDED